MVSASLQLHMKDRSGPSVMPRGPVINNEGRRELGKSILERRDQSSHNGALRRGKNQTLQPNARE